MPWQLVSRQAGLLGGCGVEKVESDPKEPRTSPSLGLETPAGGSRARWLSSRPVTRLPPAALSALAGGCHQLSRDSEPWRPIAARKRQGPPSLAGAPRPHLLRRESLASCSAPPLPPSGNRLAPAARLAAAA